MSSLIESLRTLRESGFTDKDVVLGFQFLHKYADFLYEAKAIQEFETEEDGESLFLVHYKGWPPSDDMQLTADEILDQAYPYSKEDAKRAADEVVAAQRKKGYIKGEKKSRTSKSSSSRKSTASLSTSSVSQVTTPQQKKESFTLGSSSRRSQAASQSVRKEPSTSETSASTQQAKSSLRLKLSTAGISASRSPVKSQRPSKTDVSKVSAQRSQAAPQSVRKESTEKSASLLPVKPQRPSKTDVSKVSSQQSQAAPQSVRKESTEKSASLLPVKPQRPSKTDVSKVSSQQSQAAPQSVRKESTEKSASLLPVKPQQHSKTNVVPPKVKSQEPQELFSGAKSSKPQKFKDAFVEIKARSQQKPKEVISEVKTQESQDEVVEIKVEPLEFPANLNITGIESRFPAYVTIDKAIDEYVQALKSGRPNPYPIYDLEMSIEGAQALKAQVNKHLPIYFTKKEFPEYIKQLNKKRVAKNLDPVNLSDYREDPDVNKENMEAEGKKESVFKKLLKVQLPLTDVFDVIFLIRFLKTLDEKKDGTIKHMFALCRPMWNDMLKFISENVVKDFYEK